MVYKAMVRVRRLEHACEQKGYDNGGDSDDHCSCKTP
jgi:hypothetical protein